MKFNLWIKIASPLTAMLLIVGCSKGVQNNVKHEKQVVSEREQSGYKSDYINNREVENTDLHVLAKKVLSTSYLNSKTRENLKILKEEIHLLNTKIIKGYQQDPYNKIVHNILNTYVNIIFEGCDDKLRYCSNIKYFNTSHLSYKVLLLAARQEKDVFKYYKILKVANGYLNSAEDPSFTILYISRSDEYSKKLQNFPEILKQHRNYIENLLANFTLSKSSNDREAVEQLLKNYNPWNHDSTSRANTSASSEFFKIAAKSFLYDKNGDLNKQLQKLLKSEKVAAETFWDDKNENTTVGTFWRNKINIEKSVLKNRLMKKISLEIENDEFLFLIDRLFTGKLLNSEIAELLASIRRKYPREQANKKLIDVSVAYFYAQICQAILDTKTFIEDELVINIDDQNKGEIFNSIIQKSTPLSLKWNSLSGSNKKMFEFIVSEVGVDNKAHDLFLALDRNIKYISVAQLMTLMSYYISVHDLSFTLRGFFGEYEIKSQRIITDFLDGKTDPWFNFTPDSKSLEKAEILLSFYYLKQLGLLQTSKSVNYEKLFYTIFNEYLLTAKKEIESFKRDTINNKNSSNYDYLMHVCQIERQRRGCENRSSCTASKVEASVERPYKVTIDSASDFKDYSFLGSLSPAFSSSGQLRYFNVFYGGLSSSGTSGHLDKIYDDYMPKINFIKTIYNSLNFDQNNNIGRLLESIERNIKEVIEVVNHNNFDSSQCLFLFSEIEWQQNFKIALKEKERLEILHDQIIKMKQGELNLADINSDLSKNYGKFKFFDYIDQNGNYIMHKSDNTFRFINYLKEINPSVNVNLSNFENDSSYKTKNNVVVPFAKARDTFVKNALKSIFSANTGAFKWFDQATELQTFLKRFETLIKTDNLNAILGIKSKVSLIEERKQLLTLININRENREDVILNSLEKKSKFSLDLIREVLFDNKMEPWNLHSYTLNKVNIKSNYFADVVNIHNTLNSTGTLVFPVGDELYDSFFNVNAPLLNSIIKNSKEFIKEAEEDYNNSTSFVVNYALPDHKLNYHDDEEFNNQAISAIDFSNWKSRICEFIYSTNEMLVEAQAAGCKR